MTRLSAVLVLALLAMPAMPAMAGKHALPSREQCRQAAEGMIKAGEEALARGGPSERVEKRRRLVEGWKKRLAAGEDPCAVYTDIGKAATTF